MSQTYRGVQKVVLCIDDSPAILEYERRVLERSGHLGRDLYLVATGPEDCGALQLRRSPP